MKYLFLFLLTFSLLYAYEWNLICSENHEIYGFAQNFEGNYPFVLACEDGLLLKNGDEWLQATYGLPVWDVLLIGNNEFLLVQGNGSYSDGVYKFNENTLAFEVMEWIYCPNFLVFNQDQQTYYVGAYEGLFKSIDGENWEEVTCFSDMNCVDLVFWQNHFAVSVSGNIYGVHYSDDYGLSWNASSGGCPYINDMHFGAAGTLFGIFPGFSNSSGLWSSSDFGASWQVEFWEMNLSSVGNDMAGNTFVGWEADDGVAKWLGNDLIFMNVGLPNLSINKLFVNPVMSVIHIMALTDYGAYILTNYLSSDPVFPIPEIKLSNHPNPFNPSTEISFQISDFIDQNLEIQIFNSKGQKVKVLDCINRVDANARDSRSTFSITWDGTKSTGKACPSGVYLYKLVSGEKDLAANKMLLLK